MDIQKNIQKLFIHKMSKIFMDIIHKLFIHKLSIIFGCIFIFICFLTSLVINVLTRPSKCFEVL